MEYYVKSLTLAIQQNYRRFTAVEKRIADFFLENREWVDLSSKAMAKRLYVSEASLSRFARKCGYRGYRELVYQYERIYAANQEPVAGTTRRALTAYHELLNKMYGFIDEAQIARVGGYLGEAERVLVCGVGSSGCAAKEMELRFMRVGVQIDSIRERDSMRMQAVFQNEKSLVFGISISGETEAVLYLLGESKRRGSKTVLITGGNSERYRNICTEVLRIPSLRGLNQGGIISPQFPVLLTLDILYAAYMAQDSAQKERLLDHTLRALNYPAGTTSLS